MPLYEYFCGECSVKFEQISSFLDSDLGICPKCGEGNTKKLISRFAVGGQGDLRESTQHGCHDCDVSLDDTSHGADHHDHE